MGPAVPVVHDELIAEAPNGRRKFREIVRESMVGVVSVGPDRSSSLGKTGEPLFASGR
jgi:hypothetical protein